MANDAPPRLRLCNCLEARSHVSEPRVSKQFGAFFSILLGCLHRGGGQNLAPIAALRGAMQS